MKAIDFPQRTHMLAENQPEYETMPVYTEMKQTNITNGAYKRVSKDVPWSMTACFELSDREIEEIVRTRKLWYTQMLFGNNFQPVSLSIKNPFE